MYGEAYRVQFQSHVSLWMFKFSIGAVYEEISLAGKKRYGYYIEFDHFVQNYETSFFRDTYWKYFINNNNTYC